MVIAPAVFYLAVSHAAKATPACTIRLAICVLKCSLHLADRTKQQLASALVIGAPDSRVASPRSPASNQRSLNRGPLLFAPCNQLRLQGVRRTSAALTISRCALRRRRLTRARNTILGQRDATQATRLRIPSRLANPIPSRARDAGSGTVAATKLVMVAVAVPWMQSVQLMNQPKDEFAAMVTLPL